VDGTRTELLPLPGRLFVIITLSVKRTTAAPCR